MNSRLRLLECVGAAAAMLAIAACGGTPQQSTAAEPEAAPVGNFYVGTTDVFAILKTGSGGSWMFDQLIASGQQPEKGFLVRLNDLAPAFDTRVAECTPQAYPTDHKCSPAHPFRDKNVGVLGKIINGGLAAGTAGKVTEVSRTYETAFDETTFNQAVDEALVNSGLNDNRQELLSSIEEYAAVLETGSSQLAQLEREADASYRDTSSVKLNFEADITGLTDYYTYDIDFADVVSLVPQSVDESGWKKPQAVEILPCDARLCMQKARGAIATFKRSVRTHKQQLGNNTAGNYSYDLVCDQTVHAGYLFSLRCPQKVTVEAGDSASLPLAVEILARDFDALFPDVGLSDERLRIDINDEEVKFTNLTTDYLSVGAQTVYYNSQVHTSGVEISVAPGAAVTRRMRDFVSPAIEIESSYRRMTPDKASSATFQFGFAAKYRIAGDAADSTLFEQNSFNVGCVIDNRVRPGSCSDRSDLDTRTVKRSATPVPF